MSSYEYMRQGTHDDSLGWRLLKNFAYLFAVAITVLCAMLLWEIMFGSNPYHPIWDRSYSWYPRVTELGLFSSIGSSVITLNDRIIVASRSLLARAKENLFAGGRSPSGNT